MSRRIELERILIFAVALAVRGVIAWTFFGSVDTANDLLNTARMFSGWHATQIPVPYLPGIQLVLWTGGLVAIHTPWPLTFGYKIFGVLFDSVLAIIVHDYAAADRRRALRLGLLYAFAPVPLIIASIHGQRDAGSIALLLLSFLLLSRGTRPGSFLAGFCYALSIVIKPIALPFVLLLFGAPWRRRVEPEAGRRPALHQLAVIAGIVACALAYLGITQALGVRITASTIEKVFGYAKGGVQLFGLPVLLDVKPNRLLTLAPLLVLIPMYWKGILTRERVVLLTFAFVVGTAGLGPQYLMWIVPLLLICGRERFAALYSLLAGTLLIIHYHHPGPAGMNMENLGAFGPLSGAAWLAPAATFLDAKTFLYLFLGGVALPIACLAFGISELLKILRSRTRAVEAATPLSATSIIAPAVVALAVVGGLAVWAASRPAPTVPAFVAMMRPKLDAYAIHRYRGPGLMSPKDPAWVIPAYAQDIEHPRPRAIDAVSIGYAWVLVWSVAAWMSKRPEA